MPSTPIPRPTLLTLDVAAALAAGLAGTLAATGGLTLELGELRLSLHAWPRAALAAVVLVAARTWRARAAHGVSGVSAHLTSVAEVALAATALTSVGYWLVLLTMACGGADSYGYVIASERLLAGRLIEPQPLATVLPVSDPLAVSAPAGQVPAGDASGIAPSYPLGFPALMAVATIFVGPLGPYVVAPLCGIVCVVLGWRLGTAWFGSLAGGLAAVLVAWEPLVVTYAKQPMSDVPAAMWTLLAVWWLHGSHPRPFAAGVATGWSFITRPGGLGALAVVGIFTWFGRADRWSRVAWFSAGAVPFALVQAILQWRLYGSALRTGHGSVAALFAGDDVAANLAIYADAMWQSHSLIWFAGAAAALGIRRRAPAWIAVAMLGASAVPYLLYWRFDHWETLRFLLPAIVLLSIVAAGGLTTIVTARWPAGAPVVALVCGLVVAVSSQRFLREQGVPGLREAEARYPRVAARIAATTPTSAVVLAMQHSGSIRHYAGRDTLRWDVLGVEELEPVVAALSARGHTVYVALEGDEQRQFDAKFGTAFSRVRRLPAGQVGVVQIWQLDVPGR